MKKLGIGAALGLFVALGAIAPARAEQLRNKQDPNMCLAISPQGRAIIWYCSGTSQDWSEQVSRIPWAFDLRDANGAANLCLGSPTIYYGANLGMLGCGNYYLWNRIDPGRNDGCFYYTRILSDLDFGVPMVMGVQAARNGQPLRAGTAVIMWSLTYEDNQEWCPE